MAPPEPAFVMRKKNKKDKKAKKEKKNKTKAVEKQTCKAKCIHAGDSYVQPLRTEDYPFVPKSGDRFVTSINCVDKEMVEIYNQK